MGRREGSNGIYNRNSYALSYRTAWYVNHKRVEYERKRKRKKE